MLLFTELPLPSSPQAARQPTGQLQISVVAWPVSPEPWRRFAWVSPMARAYAHARGNKLERLEFRGLRDVSSAAQGDAHAALCVDASGRGPVDFVGTDDPTSSADQGVRDAVVW